MMLQESLKRHRLLLGVTGGIAAYKTPDLARKLIAADFEVQAVMTSSASAFVAPMALQAVCGRPVRTALIDLDAEAGGMDHIKLARWPDLVLIAPATADFIARLASGRANDLLAALVLASEAPIAIAPAMNRVMWENPRTQRNIDLLCRDGITVLGPDQGEQACGEIGFGRMAEPEDLCRQMLALSRRTSVQKRGELAGVSAVITAGPTQEAIDPVRYISNRSSGKQGYALAIACLQAGAEVKLISGPVSLPPPAGIREHIQVTTAEQMHAAVLQHIRGADLFIGTAAVADYRPCKPAAQKIKKSNTAREVTLDLTENPDIIATVASLPDRPYVVGFAAETHRPLQHAEAKRARKNLDMIVLNDVSEPGIGFDSDDNQVTIITADEQTNLPRQDKYRLATELVSHISAGLLAARRSEPANS